MTPKEYLEQSNQYANKVEKIRQDDLPAYTSSTTDHNNMEAAQEVVAMIADDPKKYKNFKFIPGCEFMFLDNENGFNSPSFEAVGLGVNPFSKEILDKLSAFNSIDLISKIREENAVVSYAHPARFCQKNRYIPEFIKYLKRIGINAIESNYQYVGFKNSEEISRQIKEIQQIAKENNFFETGGNDTHSPNIFTKHYKNI